MKNVLGQLEDTGTAEGIGAAIGLGLGVQAGRLLLVDIGQEIELFWDKIQTGCSCAEECQWTR